tara:strand:- start:26 stop:661 length:636 start_codon:yes stop_codon:yes gene_type:complete
MASVNAPRGLVLARKNGSGSNSTGISTIDLTQTSVVPSALMPNNVFTGDPIKCYPAGTIIPCTASTTEKINGVFQGCSYVSSTGAQKYSRYWTGGATATDVKIFISDDPQQTYFIQADATCTAKDGYAGHNTCNVDYVAGSGGSTKTGNSSYGLNADTIHVDGATSPLRIIRRATWDTGTGTSAGATDAYPWWEVRINQHIDNYVTTTLSV